MYRNKWRVSRAVIAVLAAFVAIAFSATSASAHVSVSSPDAKKEGYGKLVFRVPNEMQNATTTKVEINLPADTPFGSVSTKPVPGWDITAAKNKLPTPIKTDDDTVTEAVTKVTWSAQATGIAVGQFQEFEMSVGTFPNKDSISFPATQTYSDGTVVQWNQTPASDKAEPEHPSPTLKLTTATDNKSDSDNTARIIAIAALVVSVLAAGLGLVRRRA